MIFNKERFHFIRKKIINTAFKTKEIKTIFLTKKIEKNHKIIHITTALTTIKKKIILRRKG